MPTVCCPNCGHAFALPPEIRRPGPRTPAWEWPTWVQARFWSSVRKTDTHWFWEGPTNGSGYGVFSYQSRRYYSHIVAWQLAHGAFPSGKVLDHVCRLRLCCHPSLDHLEPVTSRDNTLRGTNIAARRFAQETCVHGHLLDEANTTVYRRKSGTWGRRCRACHRERQRRLKAEARERARSAGTYQEKARPGVRNGRARLTVEHVRAIRALACPSPGQGKRGGNIAAVAAAYGISPSQVVRILRGECWRTDGEAP